MLNWIKKVKLMDYGTLLIKERVLIIADLHLGYETYLEKQGITIPKNQFDETIKRIKEQGGLVAIPHPFDRVRRCRIKKQKLREELLLQ